MSKRKYIVVQELDPDDVSDIADAQKRHYISLGYKPFLMADGRTKWLTDTQRAVRESKAKHPFSLRRLFKHAPASRRRKRRHRSDFSKLILANKGFILLLFGILIAVLLLMRFWSLIF